MLAVEKKIYFSSDWHLDHANVIKYDSRPFQNVNEMNETLIRNYNSIVKPQDDFYFLGDFCFNPKHTDYFLSRLQGNLFFIRGNHDDTRKTVPLYEKYGTYLGEQNEIKIGDQKIVLNHYARRVWNQSHRGAILLYGHSHGGLEQNPWGKSMDVCCTLNDYKPWSWEQIQDIMESRNPKIIDHHK